MEPGIDGTTSGYLPQADSDDALGGRGGVLTSAHAPGQSYAPMLIPPSRRPEEITPQGQWPLRSYIELGALSSAVPCARLHTRHLLWGRMQKSLVKDAELVVSELATNAITATQAIESVHPVWLWLLCDSLRILIMVGDASPHPPRPIDPMTTETEGGRGLLLVEGLSRGWGWYAVHHRPGTTKVVWAELHVPPRAGQAMNGSGDSHA